MRETRVNVWNTTTVTTNTTINGPTIDLLNGYVGGHLYGTGEYGIGVELVADNAVAGTTAYSVKLKWQHSTDGTSWDDFGTIGTFDVDTAGKFVVNGSASPLSRDVLKSNAEMARRYARIVAVSSGFAGGASLRLRGWLADGAIGRLDAGTHY